jgi:hypothetical protein
MKIHAIDQKALNVATFNESSKLDSVILCRSVITNISVIKHIAIETEVDPQKKKTDHKIRSGFSVLTAIQLHTLTRMSLQQPSKPNDIQ